MRTTYKSTRKPLTLTELASHSISAALLVASVYAAVCIDRSEKIDPDTTAVQASPSGMF